jgi:predicted transcriptional regulator
MLSDVKMCVVLENDDVIGIITKIDLIDFLARRAS